MRQRSTLLTSPFDVIFVSGINMVFIHMQPVSAGKKDKFVNIIKLCLGYFFRKQWVVL